MMRYIPKYLAILLPVFLLLPASLRGETGREAVKHRSTAAEEEGKLFQRALKVLKKKEHTAAQAEFTTLIRRFRRSNRLPEYKFYLAESLYAQDKFYDAHWIYHEILKSHPGFAKLPQVIEREYQIGSAFITGRQKKLLFTVRFSEAGILGKIFRLFPVSAKGLGCDILRGLLDEYEQKYFDYAHFLVANYYRETGEYELAIKEYDKLVAKYPTSEWVRVSGYYKAISYLGLSHGYDHDLTPARRAEALLREFVSKYSTAGKIREDAEKKLKEVREALAYRDVDMARFYLRERRPKSAALYLKSILRDFPETEAAERARTMLGKIEKSGGKAGP
jgi:outer membrane protein assembly factor BamD (BamD/ComL family)